MWNQVRAVTQEVKFRDVPRIRLSRTPLASKEAIEVERKLLQELEKRFVHKTTKALLPWAAENPEHTQWLHKQPAITCTIQPRKKIPYTYCIATGDDDAYITAKQHGTNVIVVSRPEDIQSLADYDVVRVIQAPPYCEHAPNTIPASTIDEALAEQQLLQLSIIEEHLERHQISPPPSTTVESEELEDESNALNAAVEEELQSKDFTGQQVLQALRSSTLPQAVQEAIRNAKKHAQHPTLYSNTFPITFDEEKAQETHAQRHIKVAEEVSGWIKENKLTLPRTKELSEQIKAEILVADYKQAASIGEQRVSVTHQIMLKEAQNPLLTNPTPITYSLRAGHASVLTGANSGGKTTLLEHLILLHTARKYGILLRGEAGIPDFNTIHYLSKSSGSMGKGAFETMLQQFANLNPKNALILADELEAVTEPGVAAKILEAIIEHFTTKGSTVILATHLGQELEGRLPKNARIDGIIARGITEEGEIDVDHNPVMGQLANSTPELIIEKSARENNNEFFVYLAKKVKK